MLYTVADTSLISVTYISMTDFRYLGVECLIVQYVDPVIQTLFSLISSTEV